MRFEERDLSTYPNTVSAKELKEGEVYFSVDYLDDELLHPRLEPLVFIGRNLEPEDIAFVYFQDAYSYQEGVRYGVADESRDATFYRFDEDELHIFDYESALNELMRCSLRRRNIQDDDV